MRLSKRLAFMVLFFGTSTGLVHIEHMALAQIKAKIEPTIAASDPINMLLRAKPQYSRTSCRSYALALAVGTLPNSPYPILTASQLRASEKDLQARLITTAKAMGKRKKGEDYKPGDHEVWQRAIAEWTSGKIELSVKYCKGEEFFTQLGQTLTRPSFVGGDAATAARWANTPVMTSVKKMGPDTYDPSHIVTIYGLGGSPEVKPATPLTRPLIVLNPAVKVKNVDRKACEIDDVQNDERWSGILSIEADYELNAFDKGYLFMVVRYAGK